LPHPSREVRLARPRPRRRWLAVVLPLALLAAVIGAGAGYLALMGRDPVRDAHALLDPPFGGREQVNILVIGVDNDREPRRSDTLLLGTLNLSSRSAAMISIPRDLRLEIPRHGIQKVNAAFTLGGVDLVRETVTTRFGVPVDYTVKVTIPALEAMVDAMGGVVIDVDRRMRYRDHAQRLSIDLKPGRQRLDGGQALGYVRFRQDALGDLARIQRQQNFIRQVAAQATAPEQRRNIPKLADIVLKNVETDLTVKDLMALADFARSTDLDAIQTATLPSRPVVVDGISYLDPDWPAIASVVRQVVSGQGALVEVLYSSGRELAGRQVARRLEADGFRIARVAQARGSVPRTRVIARRDSGQGADRIGRLLQCDTQSGSAPGGADADITVLVGSDYQGQATRS